MENNKIWVYVLIVLVVIGGGWYLISRNQSKENIDPTADPCIPSPEVPCVEEGASADANTSNPVENKDITNNTNTKMENKIIQLEGVKITVLKEGSGAEAKGGDTVAMNYTGRLENGTVFDSNTDPKFQHVDPLVFTLGVGQVIKGWDLGVAGMKPGEKRTLEIDADYAYGASGAGGGLIPPNAKLIFDVELLAIKK